MGNAALLLLGVAAVVLCLWRVPIWQVARSKGVKPENQFERENEARKTLAQILGGVVVLAGLYSSVQTFNLSMQTFNLSREGQITDRFTKAVEQLGNKDFSIRLGGIFSLEQIARESEGDEHRAVFEILSAYARGHSAVADYREDVKAVMLVVGRRKIELDDAVHPVNLDGVDLRTFDLRRANYSNVSFVGALFQGSRLSECRFNHAVLRGCNFDGADLSKARFNDKAILSRASFLNSRLFGAELRDADLSSAVLEGASLWNADLTRARLTGASIKGADLTGGAIVSREQLGSAIGIPAKQPTSSTTNAPRIRWRSGDRLDLVHGVSKVPVSPDSPIVAGEFLEIYCDGLGDLQWPDPDTTTEANRLLPITTVRPSVMIDGKEVKETDYTGAAPATPASYQINLRIPDLPPGKHSLTIVVGKDSSELYWIVIGAPALRAK